MLILLIIYALCISPLIIYSLCYLITAAIILFKTNKFSESYTNTDFGDLALIIPTYNEGESLIDTIKTITHQDYIGRINIYILMKDKNDSSYAYLIAYLNNLLPTNRSVVPILTEKKSKRDNINYLLPKLNEKYIGFLDADHRADQKWVSSSLYLLKENNYDAIQSVRRPLAISSFFQVWDSIQNHIGNEVFNRLYNHFNFSTYFTGTTCIFKSEAVKDKSLPDSLTEDTALSYELIINGKTIGLNQHYGSYEEVSPDLSTYIARRRRWSNGHSLTFIRNLKNIFSAPIKVKQKIQMILHGSYYLLPLLIIASSQITGWYFYFQYTSTVQILCLGISIFLSLSVALLRYRSLNDVLIESFVSFLTIFPYIAITSILFYRTYQQEYYYYVINFPYYKALYWIISFMLLAPVSVLIIGRKFFKHPSLIVFLSHLLFYPAVLIIDIFSCTLGFVDLIFKRKHWGVIKRSHIVDTSIVPQSISQNLNQDKFKIRKFYGILIIPFSIILIILGNDFLIFHNCGKPTYLFNDYFFFQNTPPLQSQLKIQMKSLEGGKYLLTLRNEIQNNNEVEGNVKISIGDKTIYKGDLKSEIISLEHVDNMGWETEKINVDIKTNRFSCHQTKLYATSVKEIIDNKLYLNGEPFLIKCIIPSPNKTKELQESMQQLKSAGANCIRIYHSPTKDLLKIAKEQQLLIISQPDETTWDNIRIYENHNIKKIVKKYREHIKSTEGNPYILFEHLGNELALNDYPFESKENLIKAFKILKNKDYYRYPISYSTYQTFAHYPIDIIGVNMLDSGNLYWNEALSHTQSLGTPFYASELGGFVAYYENTPTFLRIHRLYKNWESLLSKGGLGAAFFQSHDNWAQPVPFGYNDPFKDELPDDRRGFWDTNNQPKKELRHLSNILTDFNFSFNTKDKLIITNRRNYNLNKIVFNIDQKKYYISKLASNKAYIIPMKKKKSFEIKASYFTHSGLENIINFIYAPNEGIEPEVLKKITLDKVFQKLNQSWVNFKNNNVSGGKIELKLTLPQNISENTYLVLEGSGSSLLTISNPNNNTQTQLSIHNYREHTIQLSNIWNAIGNTKEIHLFLDRNKTIYLNKKDGKEIPIKLVRPYLIREI